MPISLENPLHTVLGANFCLRGIEPSVVVNEHRRIKCH